MREIDSIGYFLNQRFSLQEVEHLIKIGFAFDARKGGLVLGRSHDDGGIFILTDWGDHYRLTGELEGGEYVWGVGATVLAKSEFYRLNDQSGLKKIEGKIFIPPPEIMTIDTRFPIPKGWQGKFVLFEGLGSHSIFSSSSTKAHYQEINYYNKRYSHYYLGGDSYSNHTHIAIKDNHIGHTYKFELIRKNESGY